MLQHYAAFLWLLKLGALANLYFLFTVCGLAAGSGSRRSSSRRRSYLPSLPIGASFRFGTRTTSSSTIPCSPRSS